MQRKPVDVIKGFGSRFLGRLAVLKPNLAIKTTAITTILIALVSAFSSVVIYNLSYNALKGDIRNNLILLASNAAANINPGQLAQITKPADEGNETYLKLQKQLQRIQASSHGKIRYVYTLGRSGDYYFYVIDAAPISDAANHSSVGDKFDVNEYPVAIEGFTHATAELEPSPEDFGGMTQTGYAPIQDDQGNTVGVLAMDMDVSVLAEKEHDMKQSRTIAVIIAVVFAALSGVLFSKYLTAPIMRLKQVTERVAGGDLSAHVKIRRNDEFGQLARSFNAMTRDLKVSHQRLKKYSMELESKVASRTAELSVANKEIKDILDNMSQAVFTIDRDLSFNKQHSKFAERIFRETEFDGKSILDVFFNEPDAVQQRSNMQTWLNKLFNEPSSNWDNIKALQPVKEAKISMGTVNQKTVKYISLDFEPILDDDRPDSGEKINKIMVIVQDITDKKLLAMEVERKEQENRDNINQIVEIIKADKELFEEYISEVKRYLEGAAPKLIALRDNPENKDSIDDLCRIMHTIKGNSKAFSLERIAGQSHSIENIFSAIRKGEKMLDDALLDEAFAKLDKLNAIVDETMEIYKKILKGMTMDSGKARNEKSLQEDIEYLRIKVKDLNRISELIKKAEASISDKEYEQTRGIFSETHAQLALMQKIDVGRMFARFPRMVRDLSAELGKKVRLVMSGEGIMIDKNVYDRICDPIVHMIRNSLDHGIEKPEDRVKAGKPEEGCIILKVSVDNQLLRIELLDDGRGLDFDRIRACAVIKGLITPEQALEMDDNDAMNLIFRPGFSTNENVTAISGRGVGMDVVKTYIERYLKGKVKVASVRGKGLDIAIEVPV